MRESEIEKYLCDRVKAEGGIALKFTSPGRKGVPDRIILMPGGVILFVELKANNAELNDAQYRTRILFNNLDTPIYAINSKNQVDWFIEHKL